MTVIGSYFWRVRDEEVQQEALAAARRAQHQRVADVLDVQSRSEYGVWCRVSKMASASRPRCGTDAWPGIEREEKAQVGVVRLEQRQPPEVVGAVAGHDAQPGVEQVVGLLDERAVVGRHHLDRFRRGALDDARVAVEQHQRQGTFAEEVAVDLQLGQRVAELPHRGARRSRRPASPPAACPARRS